MNDNPLKIGNPNELGAGWNISTLAEITIFIKDGTHGTHERVEQGFPLLSAKDISKTGKIELNNNPSLISKSDFELIHSKYEIEMDDILLTVVGTLGRCAICVTQDKFSIQRSVAVIRLNQLAVECRYLYYFFSGSWFQSQLQLRSNSTAQAGVYLGELAQIEVAYPPLPQQKKIAKILTTVDNLIEQTQALIEKYTAIKQGMMADLFTRGIDLNGTPETNPNHGQLRPSFEEAPELYKETELGWVPREWEICLLGELAHISSGITLGNEYDGADAIEVPYLRVANVQDGYLDLSDIKTIKISKENLARYLLKDGDVLMNEGGDFDKLGRGAIWRGEVDSCCHQNHVFKVRANISLLVPEYLAYWSASPYGKKYFVINSKQSTNLASINSSQLKKFPLLIQSPKEQKEIVQRIQSCDCSLSSMNDTVAKYEKIKKGLMQDLLTGKVQVIV